MNENTEANISAESEAFDLGWDENLAENVSTDEPAEVEETADEQTEAESGGENQPAESTAEETQEAEKNDETAGEYFELNYMGKRETVGRDEIITLAQKGKDYDRIRSERDAVMPELEELRKLKATNDIYSNFLTKLAGQSGTDIQGLMDSIEARMMVDEEKAKGNVITEDFALQKIKFNRERAEFEAQKKAKEKPAEEPKIQPEHSREDAEEAKRRDEFIAFSKEYPDVKPNDIPKEVWDAFSSGKSLVGAYSLYENRQLKQKLAAAEQETKNRERSTGSRDSAGAGTKKDAFDLGWDSF